MTDAALIEKACALLADPDTPRGVAQVAQSCGIPRGTLGALFNRVLGITPRNFQSISRATAFESALRQGGRVIDAAYAAGYGTLSRAYENSAPYRGGTPRELKKGGGKMVLRYAIRPCSLGLVLVGASDRGVCLVAIDDTRDALLADMNRRFPKAGFEEAMPGSPYDAWITATVNAIESPSPQTKGGSGTGRAPAEIANGSVPLDIQGTAFQQKVWSALRAIPPGETVTYSALAAAIDRPTATRAVAAACGANRLAVLIPCHRVIGKSGQLTGYRWGVERKRALLEREGG